MVHDANASPAPSSDRKEGVFDQSVNDDKLLEEMGYKPEFKRTFGLVGMIGFSFSIVTCWTALSGVLAIGATSGGPPVMIWSWLAICLITLAVAYSMAEMCSAYPVAGGQYSWVFILAPKKYARGMSYLCGWFMLIGILAMGATNNNIFANFILGMANLGNPSYTIKRWQTVLVTYLMNFLLTLSNIFAAKLLDKISRFMLVWNIMSFFVVIITILATNHNKRSASFVFGDFQNFTGFSYGYTAVIGVVQSAFGMCCYDAPAHMVEELKDARKQAPKAIIMSVFLGAVTGFAFLVAVCFCIGDIENTALTPTGVPIVQIFYDSTGSVAGSCVLTSMITLIVLVSGNGLMAEGSRSVFAFARDRGLPFSDTLSKVNHKLGAPIAAILVTSLVQAVLNSILFGTLNGFLTVVTIATEGFYLSYAMPLLARLLSYKDTKDGLPGAYNLGRWGVWLNLLGVLFLLYNCITFNFPTVAPVDSDNMNYCSAAVGAIMLLSLVTWFVTAKKQFRGPEGGHLVEAVEVLEHEQAVRVEADAEKEKGI